MRCEELRKYLSPYIDSELDATVCTAVVDHLAQCQSCNQRFNQEQEIERLLSERLRKEGMPDAFWKAVLAKLDTSKNIRISRYSIKWLVPAVVIPVLAIVLSVVFLWVKVPERGLIPVVQDIHGRYLKEEISLGPEVSWPEEFKRVSLLSWLPQSGEFEGHQFRLIGVRPCDINDTKAAYCVYECCRIPVSIFVLRKEDLHNFPQARNMLEKNRGSVTLSRRGMNLGMIDLGEVVICGISSHPIGSFLETFKRV
jgi:hypothetical protein